MQGDGIMDSDTPGAIILADAARLRTFVEVQIVSGHGDSFSGGAVVASFQRAGAMDGAETFNVSLQSHGQVSYAGAS